jgi:formylglycine-generating enzyme required for sulfatase activity
VKTWMFPVILLLVAGLAGCGEEPQQAADEPKPKAAKPAEGQVQSRKADGQTVAVPLEKHSLADQEHIRRLTAETNISEEDDKAAIGRLVPRELAMDVGGGVKMEFVLIPAGRFMMGDDKEYSAKPAHRVTITQPFYLGKYEVTQEQWEAVMGNNPSRFKGPKNPVEMVSWQGCQDFMAKLNEKSWAGGARFSLPTEAQWEYACRAGTTTQWSFGDDRGKLGDYAWWGGNAAETTHPVGQKKPNAWGLYDMHGNVFEWCADWYRRYEPGDQTDPVGPDSGDNGDLPTGSHVLRGGSWNYHGPERFSCACRGLQFAQPTAGSIDFGFRVSTTLTP